ncbi:MAG: hypothetical protein WAO20_17205 [Acidobacteriota bacterium]
MRVRFSVSVFLAIACFLVLTGPAAAQGTPAQTPPELVKAYQSLADTILGGKHTEKNLVLAILATTYGHAQGTYAQAKAKISAGRDARTDLERLATYVSQLGNEGDAAVAGVRKRLLEGGHHHNAQGEDQGLYDEGFVVVTKAAKKAFLDAAGEIAKLTRSPNAEALDQAWERVEGEYQKLMKEAGN